MFCGFNNHYIATWFQMKKTNQYLTIVYEVNMILICVKHFYLTPVLSPATREPESCSPVMAANIIKDLNDILISTMSSLSCFEAWKPPKFD